METRSETWIYEHGKEWEPAGEGVVRQIMGYNGQVMLVKVKFEKGAVGSLHTHHHTQTTYVASGKFEFTINEETKTVETGDGLYIAPDLVHGCTCLEPGVLIDCFSPMRADFIDH
ncbi:cupin domain-containing protein [Bacteroides neonati]|uniref:cupin domain-containing protein n=1 Tax=Bacteroides neonati TaxID=1347393 RepID=UPI0005A88C0E|nr:cupin domain-containing protein [Bacteroides neonati]